MKSRVATDVARRLLMTVAVIALAPAAFALSSGADGTDPQSFFVLNNPGDPNFNQLLGVNDRSSSAISVIAPLLRITATCWFQEITTQ
jgi:hypothetical protein